MKKLLALVLALALSLGMVACAAPAGEVSDSPNPSSPPPSGSSEAQQPEPDESLSGQIRYVSMWNETEPQADVIKAAIDEFTTIYPNVEITVNWMGRDTLKTIMASLDAGQVDLWDQGINHVIQNYNDYG